jgi:hypothetical protein
MNVVKGRAGIAPFIFKKEMCFVIETGVKLYSPPKKGRFVNTCDEGVQFNMLNVGFYPNPVITTATLKFGNRPNLNEEFTIRVYTILGNLIRIEKQSGYNLYQGIKLDFSSLIPGPYVLTIESKNSRDAIKFIKI